MQGSKLIEPLETAIKGGDVETARHIIRTTGRMFVGKSNYLYTPLTVALKEKQAGVVDMLLREGADLHMSSSMFNESPLVTAARTCDIRLVQMLLDAGADVNVKGARDGGIGYSVYTTPLHVAATQDNPAMLNMLLAANAQTSLKNMKHETALHLAAYSGNKVHIQRLVACKAQLDDVDKQGFTPLHHTISRGHMDCAKELVKAGCSLNLPTNTGSTPLMLAIKKAHLGILKLLLHNGCSVDRTEGSLERAATHTVITACPHRTGRKKAISINQEIECLESLVAAGADINLADVNKETPLHLCVQIGCVSLLEYIIKCPLTRVDTVNSDGDSPLSTACKMPENSSMTRLLIQYCPLLVNSRTTTHPLMLILAKERSMYNMRLLLEAGYQCSRAEAETCRDLYEVVDTQLVSLPEVVQFVDESLLQPWPLLRLCRLRIRDRLSSGLNRKVFKLPIPQLLRDKVLLYDY